MNEQHTHQTQSARPVASRAHLVAPDMAPGRAYGGLGFGGLVAWPGGDWGSPGRPAPYGRCPADRRSRGQETRRGRVVHWSRSRLALLELALAVAMAFAGLLIQFGVPW